LSFQRLRDGDEGISRKVPILHLPPTALSEVVLPESEDVGGAGGSDGGAVEFEIRNNLEFPVIRFVKPKKTERNSDPVAEIPVQTCAGTSILLNTTQVANKCF